MRLDEYAINGIQKTYTTYTYHPNGNRTGDLNRVPTTLNHNYEYTGNEGTWGGDWNEYTYDALNRLVREYEHDTNQSAEYAYDHLGNRILEKDHRDTLHYTYNELNRLVQKKAFNGVSTYEYDKRGNRVLETSEHTQENRRTLEWDAANRLTGGTRGTDWSLYKSEYTYNGLGMRVNSTIEGPEHTVYDRDYLIDYVSPERNDLAEYNVGHYQWQGTKPVHELKYLYTADGQRLEVDALHYSQWGGSDTQYTLNIHEDIMGSAVAYTYQGGWNDGQWANKHEFDVWGYNSKSPTYNYDPMYRSTEPYFTGHQFDGSLNIYYADNRFYDAETGTWLSPDPIKDGMNWYTYCENNPTTCIDVTGLMSTEELQNIKKWYQSGAIDDQTLGYIILLRETTGAAIDFITTSLQIETAKSGGELPAFQDIYNQVRDQNPDKPAFPQNYNLALHEIAQIASGRELMRANGAFNYNVEVRNPRGEADIAIEIQNQVYEVKTAYALTTDSGRNVAGRQLQEYVSALSRQFDIDYVKGYIPANLGATYPGTPLFTFHGHQLKESYRAAPQQGGNGKGLVGYYLYFVDHEGKKQIIENTAALSNQIAQQLNSGYKMHQIMQYQQSVAELQMEIIKLGYMGQMLVSGGLAFSYLSGLGGLASGSGAFTAGTSYFTPVNACAKAATEKIIEFVAHVTLPLAG